MEANVIKPNCLPLVVIVGPTASGKTSLSVDLAARFNGEIISADSRAVYKGLNIGTAKPSLKERKNIPHWGIDLVEPDQTYSVAEFQRYVKAKIEEIRQRGHIPFLVGGSGLYVDSIVFDYQLVENIDYEAERQKYNDMSIEQLWLYCKKHNIALPENWKNRRYVINQIIRAGNPCSCRRCVIDNCVIFGVKTDIETLKKKISDRINDMFKNGVVDEARRIGQQYGWNHESMTGNIYPILRKHIDGEINLEQAIELAKRADWRLVKKQLTWFKRNQAIEWVSLQDAQTRIVQKISSMLI